MHRDTFPYALALVGLVHFASVYTSHIRTDHVFIYAIWSRQAILEYVIAIISSRSRPIAKQTTINL